MKLSKAEQLKADIDAKLGIRQLSYSEGEIGIVTADGHQITLRTERRPWEDDRAAYTAYEALAKCLSVAYALSEKELKKQRYQETLRKAFGGTPTRNGRAYKHSEHRKFPR